MEVTENKEITLKVYITSDGDVQTGEVRRLSLGNTFPISLNLLRVKLVEIFNEADDASDEAYKPQQFQYANVKYVDEEGDKVFITSQVELDSALKLANGSLLKLFIQPLKEASSSSMSLRCSPATTPIPMEEDKPKVEVIEEVQVQPTAVTSSSTTPPAAPVQGMGVEWYQKLRDFATVTGAIRNPEIRMYIDKWSQEASACAHKVAENSVPVAQQALDVTTPYVSDAIGGVRNVAQNLVPTAQRAIDNSAPYVADSMASVRNTATGLGNKAHEMTETAVPYAQTVVDWVSPYISTVAENVRYAVSGLPTVQYDSLAAFLDSFIAFISHPNITESVPVTAADVMTHPRVVCRCCRNIVRGSRFHCCRCADYDLCSVCEKRKTTFHDPAHEFVEISQPLNARQVAEACCAHLRKLGKSPDYQAVWASREIMLPGRFSTTGCSAALIEDTTLPPGTTLARGSTYTKIWKVSNDGEVVWPAGCVLCFIGGDAICGAERVKVADIPTPPGSVVPLMVDVDLNRNPPVEARRQMSLFHLATPEGRFFGPRLWVDVNVVASAKEEPMEVDSKKPETEAPKKEEPQHEEKKKEVIVEEKKTEAPKESSEDLLMNTLVSMGFNDKAKNLELMKQHNNDLDAILYSLLGAN